MHQHWRPHPDAEKFARRHAAPDSTVRYAGSICIARILPVGRGLRAVRRKRLESTSRTFPGFR
ncbi:hypothetical protein C8258_20135 [Nocardia sp. MDA0666]|nr:hypothetical protein C8258_20135 [Nocardia sp. MDA0666]